MTLLALLPDGPPSRALAAVLNAALALDLLSRQALEPLAARTLWVEAHDLGARARLSYGPAGFRASCADRQPDVTIKARARDFVALALRLEDPDTLFFTRRLVITGDTELGLAAKNALDAIDWDRLKERLPPGAGRLARFLVLRAQEAGSRVARETRGSRVPSANS